MLDDRRGGWVSVAAGGRPGQWRVGSNCDARWLAGVGRLEVMLVLLFCMPECPHPPAPCLAAPPRCSTIPWCPPKCRLWWIQKTSGAGRARCGGGILCSSSSSSSSSSSRLTSPTPRRPSLHRPTAVLVAPPPPLLLLPLPPPGCVRWRNSPGYLRDRAPHRRPTSPPRPARTCRAIMARPCERWRIWGGGAGTRWWRWTRLA